MLLKCCILIQQALSRTNYLHVITFISDNIYMFQQKTQKKNAYRWHLPEINGVPSPPIKNEGSPRTQKQTASWKNQMCPVWITPDFASSVSAASSHLFSRGNQLGALQTPAQTPGNPTEQAMLYSVLSYQHGRLETAPSPLLQLIATRPGAMYNV